MKFFKIAITSILLIQCHYIFATAQMPDYLIVDNDTIAIYANPLEYFFNEQNPRPESFFGDEDCNSTACWRRYIAIWKLKQQKLYLREMWSCCDNPVKLDLKKLFGEKYKNNQVFADWFSEPILSPQGERLYYHHMGYGSVYEKEVVYHFENGILLDILNYKNSIKNKNLPNYITLNSIINYNINWNLFPELENDTLIKVYVVVILNRDGKVDSTYIARGSNIKKYNDEAMRVMKMIPKWEVLIRNNEIIRRNPVYLVKFTKSKWNRYK